MSGELGTGVSDTSALKPMGTEERRPVVLVVDDERLIADSLVAILAMNGFAASCAYEGESALELAKAIDPDVLITDVVMPGMTGIELAIAMEKDFPECKILLLSGNALTMDLLAGARAAGHHFTALAKPMHPGDLLARVAECLGTQLA